MLLGLDLGPTITGYCVGTGEVEPEAGAWRVPEFGKDYGRLGHWLAARLTETHRRTKFTVLAIEAPMLIVRRAADTESRVFRPTDKLPTLRAIYGMGMVAQAWAYSRGLQYGEYTAQAAKRILTGDSWAKKPAMVSAAKAEGINLPKTKADGVEDAADGYAIWRLMLREVGDKATAARWDARTAQRQGKLT